MLQDLRIAARALFRNPVFSATAVAVLALAIGANSAVFGLVNQALFSPPGLSEPSRVVAVRARYVKLNLLSISLSGPDFRDVRDTRDVFERTAVMQPGDVTYSTGGTPRVLAGARVSREWFDVFGARPLLGRTFVPEEDQPEGQRAVVLSHAAWVRVFGSDPGIVGQAITIDDKPTRVVGVMPAEFRWPREVDIWLPLALPRQEFTDDFRFNEHLMGVVTPAPRRFARGRECEDLHAGGPGPQRGGRHGRLRQVVAVEHVRDAVHRLRGGRFEAGDAGPAGCRRLRAADRVREHRRPDAGQDDQPAPRDCGARGDRRRTLASRPPDAG